MGAVQHVFRRGDVYWWRRRIGPSRVPGDRVRQPIAVSLRTRERAAARLIAAHLTLASEQFLNQETQDMLSKQQVKAMLARVVSEHLHKLNRVAAIELNDGITADEGRRMDLVTGWAFRLKAARGGHAVVEPADHQAILKCGLSANDFATIDETIVRLREKTRTTPRAKLLQMLRECDATQTNGDIAQAQTILYRGQAAALMAVDQRWSGHFDDDRLVDQVVSNEAEAYTSPEPVGQNTSRVAPERSPEQSDIHVAASGLTPADVSDSMIAPVSILEIADRLINEKAKLNEWRQKTQDQVRAVTQLFVKMLGRDDAALINQARIAEYKTLLLHLPKTYGKNPKDFDRPLADLLEHAKSLPPDKVGRQGTTLNRYLTQLKAVIEYIEDSGGSVADYKGMQRLRARTDMRARDARAPYSPADVRGFFKQPPWTGCRGERSRFTKGATIVHDALYWVPLLAKVTLARREELCGLDVDDIDTTGTIPFVNIRINDHRQLKNHQSVRRVPLTDSVLRLGLIEYRDAIEALGHRLLFPELSAASDRTPFGDVFHGDWSKVQSAVLKGSALRKSFHSFRKMSADELKDEGVSSELRADILGHGGGNITEERYASASKLKQMKQALDMLPDYFGELVKHEINLRKDVTERKPRPSAVPRRRSVVD